MRSRDLPIVLTLAACAGLLGWVLAFVDACAPDPVAAGAEPEAAP